MLRLADFVAHPDFVPLACLGLQPFTFLVKVLSQGELLYGSDTALIFYPSQQ